MSEADPAVGIRCRSFAKINYYLDVLRRREDGFHQLETVFQTVSLCDELVCRASDAGVSLRVEGRAALSAGEDNLVMRAARALQRTTGTTAGAELSLAKSIPVAAGMAGGSGNAAAALRGLNRLWGLELSEGELETLAGELGSDVPYCLHGGLTAGTGRGEVLETLGEAATQWLVLAHPDVAVSTAEIFGHPALVKSGAELLGDGRSERFSEVIDACVAGRVDEGLFNALESAALVAYPVIAECKDALSAAGCSAVLMSGSGPTVFGMCASELEAREVASRIEGFRTTVVHTVDVGVELEELE